MTLAGELAADVGVAVQHLTLLLLGGVVVCTARFKPPVKTAAVIG